MHTAIGVNEKDNFEGSGSLGSMQRAGSMELHIQPLSMVLRLVVLTWTVRFWPTWQ